MPKRSRANRCALARGEHLSSYTFVLARELLRIDGKIDIRLLIPNSISPKTLGINADDRVLGVGVRSPRLAANR